MNKAQLVAKATEVGVKRTQEQFDASTKAHLEEVIEQFENADQAKRDELNAKYDAEWANAQEEKAKAQEEKAKAEAEAKAAEDAKAQEAKAAAAKKTKQSKANKAGLSEKIALLFKNYPNAKKAFSTADGELFLSENPARNHQISLKADVEDIETHTR